MTDIVDALLSPRAIAVVLLLLALAPNLVLRCLVKAYPCDDPRRRELLSELRAVPIGERPVWVVEQIETALLDGLSSRLRSRKHGRRDRRPVRARLLPPDQPPVMRAGSIGAAVATLYFLLMGATWGVGLAIFFIPFALLLPALPVFLLALLAVQHHRRVRRTSGRAG